MPLCNLTRQGFGRSNKNQHNRHGGRCDGTCGRRSTLRSNTLWTIHGSSTRQGSWITSLSNPRRDASHATVLIQMSPRPPHVVQQDKLGTNRNNSSSTGDTLQQVDAAAFAEFVAEQRVMLKKESQKIRQEAAQVLHDELQKAFADANDRIVSFCNWYLSYPTTYKFLSIATSSAVTHAITIREEHSLTERVQQDVQEHICRKYEALVLRPARTDPQIHRAMLRALQTAHHGYQEALGKLETSLAEFVTKQAQPYYGKAPSTQDVVIDMDWAAQLQKVQHIPIVYEKTPTVALVAGGAAAGKLASTGTGVAVTKALSAKLAAPFATKAAGTALAKSAAGATGGAIVGGPIGGALGAVAGAAVGIGLDMLVNAGVSLMQRPALEQDIREALDATLSEWEECLAPELDRVQSIWFDHAAVVLKPDDYSFVRGKHEGRTMSNLLPASSISKESDSRIVSQYEATVPTKALPAMNSPSETSDTMNDSSSNTEWRD